MDNKNRVICEHYVIRSIEEVEDIANKRILLRVDYNVPIENGIIMDKTRIIRSLDTIQYLLKKNAIIILITHIETAETLPSTSILVDALSELIGEKVVFVNKIAELQEKNQKDDLNEIFSSEKIFLLENIRLLFSEEKSNSMDVASELEKIGDIYVNDAFSCSHRKHASIVAITNCLPSYGGFNLLSELYNLHRHIGHKDIGSTPNTIKEMENTSWHSKKKIMTIIGGAKCATKIPLLLSLKEKIDILAITGNIANVILGITEEKDMSDNDRFKIREIFDDQFQKRNENNDKIKAEDRTQCTIILPSDIICTKLENGIKKTYVDDVSDVSPQNTFSHPKLCNHKPKNNKQKDRDQNYIGYYDIGPFSLKKLLELIEEVDIVIWNGPVGYAEKVEYSSSTYALAYCIAKMTRKGEIISIAGGGDTIAVLEKLKITQEFSYISTGGGAFLAWLENNEIEGIKALRNCM